MPLEVHLEKDLNRSLSICIDILPKVSRTFAISILHLKGSLRTAVITSYLLCRIADTIEDDSSSPVEERTKLFRLLDHSLENEEAFHSFTTLASQTLAGDKSHLDLINKAEHVFVLHRSLEMKIQKLINRWVSEMIKGMNEFIVRYPKGIHLQTLDEYKQYCYYVAGTVGHLLTDLWKFYSPRINDKRYQTLDQLSDAFGEGLQTVNILKDIAVDVEEENAVFLPEISLRSQGSSHGKILDPTHLKHNQIVVRDMINLAREDFDKAMQYYCSLPRSALSIKRFCVLPLLFAIATLRELSNSSAMLQSGGRVKIRRKEVKLFVILSPFIIWSNRTVRWLANRTRKKPLDRHFVF